MRPRFDDDEEYITPIIGTGTATTASGDDEKPGHPAGVLWIPDVEARRAWREHYVYPDHDKPGARPIGFGRRR